MTTASMESSFRKPMLMSKPYSRPIIFLKVVVLVPYDRTFIWLRFLVITYVKFGIVSLEESFKFKVFIKTISTDRGGFQKNYFFGEHQGILNYLYIPVRGYLKEAIVIQIPYRMEQETLFQRLDLVRKFCLEIIIWLIGLRYRTTPTLHTLIRDIGARRLSRS